MEQILQQGTVLSFNNGFALVSDGYFVVSAFIPTGTTVRVGVTYSLTKRGSTYHLGSELSV
jgi:hypothetical protein